MREDFSINLLDFGCIRVFPPDFVQSVIDLYYALRDGNEALAVSAYETWGFENLSKELIEVLNIWAKFVYAPLMEDRVRPIEETNAMAYGAEAAAKVHGELKRLNAVTLADARERAADARVMLQMAGVVRTVRMRRSKSGKPFAWVELSDATGEYEVTVFSELLSSARDLFEPGTLLLLSVTAEDRDGDIRFTGEAARRLDAAAAQAASMLRVSVTSEAALEAVKRRLAGVKPASRQEAGQVVLALRLPETGREVEISLGTQAACTPTMRGALKAVEGVADVELV